MASDCKRLAAHAKDQSFAESQRITETKSPQMSAVQRTAQFATRGSQGFPPQLPHQELQGAAARGPCGRRKWRLPGLATTPAGVPQTSRPGAAVLLQNARVRNGHHLCQMLGWSSQCFIQSLAGCWTEKNKAHQVSRGHEVDGLFCAGGRSREPRGGASEAGVGAHRVWRRARASLPHVCARQHATRRARARNAGAKQERGAQVRCYACQGVQGQDLSVASLCEAFVVFLLKGVCVRLGCS